MYQDIIGPKTREQQANTELSEASLDRHLDCLPAAVRTRVELILASREDSEVITFGMLQTALQTSLPADDWQNQVAD